MPAPIKVTFNVGDITGGVEILAMGRSISEAQRFKVRYLCCGAEDEIGRPALRRRRAENSQLCRKCRSKSAGAAAGSQHAKDAEARRMARMKAGGAFDSNGGYWPFLGELGPRFGQGANQCREKRV